MSSLNAFLVITTILAFILKSVVALYVVSRFATNNSHRTFCIIFAIFTKIYSVCIFAFIVIFTTITMAHSFTPPFSVG